MQENKSKHEEKFWEMSGYSAMEWRERRFFEACHTQQERDAMYISEFDDFIEA